MRILIIALLIILIIATSSVLFENSNEEVVIDLLIENKMKEATRGVGDTYTTPITIKGEDIYTIGSETWLTSRERLPLVLQLISPKGEIAMTLTYNNEKGIVFFKLPAHSTCHKDGYTLKIKDQLNRVLVKSRLIVQPCKGIMF